VRRIQNFANIAYNICFV